MKILILSPYPKKIIQTIKKTGDSYVFKKINFKFFKRKGDWILLFLILPAYC